MPAQINEEDGNTTDLVKSNHSDTEAKLQKVSYRKIFSDPMI